MKIIAHRGNIHGPNHVDENKPEYIATAISMGYDVELDIRIVDGKIYLGHDEPVYLIDAKFLETFKDKLWCHAKNTDALNYLVKNGYNAFWHNTDDYTITSKGYIWAFPNKHTTGIYVLPEIHDTKIDPMAIGICTDYSDKYKNLCEKMHLSFTFGIITAGNNDKMLSIIIDSIREQRIPQYEIIIVGQSDITGIDIKNIQFDENIRKNWITRKKNLVCQQAKYDYIVLMHDYIKLESNWYKGYQQYRNEFGDFDLISNKITCNGKRFRDWFLSRDLILGWMGNPVHPNAYILCKNDAFLLPYDILSNDKINKYIYYSGAYFVGKRQFLLDNPLNENLCWGQGEDVEYCKRVSNKTIFKFNTYSQVSLLKVKTDIPKEDMNILKYL